jgi:light-regulated signal transduction histidine kinase (bacteriophytochrome)
VDLYRKTQQLLLHEKRLMAANKSLQSEIEDRKASEEKIRHLNEQLVQKNAHLKAINEELDRFAYVASHDLQGPLRKILVFSDKILMKNEFDKDTEKYFKKIIDSSRRMQALINDLLSLSRDATSSPGFKPVDLNVLLKEIVTELEVQIEKNNAQINIDKLPVINAVPSLMRQLFYNLISNAIKFRKEGVDPIIRIESRIRIGGNGADKNYYNIVVSDNGIGFDPKYKEEIFLVFKRLHSYHEFEGSGVGLSICKRIVEKHNGYIMAESTPGEGSTFIIELPEVQ